MPAKTILLTNGRIPFTLALARRFHAAGHRVLVAESWPRSLCCFSTAVERYFHVPSPARETDRWHEAILRIAREFGVDLIVPINEEVLYLARVAPRLPEKTQLFAADFETLIKVHNKWSFVETARTLGMAAPQTRLLTSRDDLLSEFSGGQGRKTVFKPVYSRHATYVVVQPETARELEGIEPTSRRPWVAQQYLDGRPIATFSIAHRGRITAHACYASDFSVGFGPTLAYKRYDQPAAFEWVRSFVSALEYTGQIGIDFIEDETGRVSAIECNPRLTGGLYLLKDHPAFPDAYFDPGLECIKPTSDRAHVFRFGMLFTLLRRTKTFPGFKEWARLFFRGRAANGFSWSDPLPQLMNPLLNYAFINRCLIQRKHVRLEMGADFVWNAEPEAEPEPSVS